jgi:hypothetical protein
MSIAKTSGTWQRIAVFEIDADAPIVALRRLQDELLP